MNITYVLIIIIVLTTITLICEANLKLSCSPEWNSCPLNLFGIQKYGCGCSIDRLPTSECVCNQPGYYGCDCRWLCDQCADKQFGVVIVKYCVDGAFGNGFCRDCPNNIDQYGPNCDNCIRKYLNLLQADDPLTVTRTVNYPYLGIGLQFVGQSLYSILILATGEQSFSISNYKFCEIEYQGTTCGGGINQPAGCRCIDSQYEFRLPSIPQVISNGIPLFWYERDPPLPAPSQVENHCCLRNCPGGYTGCRCNKNCGTGCRSCSDILNNVTCTECQANYYLLNPPIQDIYCATCPPGCSICTGLTPSSTCKPYACTSPDRCANECINGYWGPKCDGVCPHVCPLRSHCSQGRNGTGQCVCDHSDEVYSETLYSCIKPTCGVDRVNLCNNHGLCIQSIESVSNTGEFSEYCICDTGFTGATCSNVYSKYDECDCGTLWSNPFQSSLGLLPKMRLTVDLVDIKLFGTQSPKAGIPVGNIEQAKYLCYQDFECDGFLIWSSPLYGLQTDQADIFPQPVTLVAFFTKDSTITPGSPPSALPTGITFNVYTIDRIQQNNCSNPTLDLTYYYTPQSRPTIIQYCTETQQQSISYVVNNWLGRAIHKDCFGAFVIQDSNPFTPSQNYWPIRHWRYHAHKFRSLKPRVNCELQPQVYSPSSYCHTSRCLSISGTGPPCIMDGQRTGYCLANPQHQSGYQCNCLTFFEANSVGTGSLNYQPFFMGLACQFPVISFCVNGQDTVLCNGVTNACQSVKQWNGEFYLQNFEGFRTLLNQDFLPRCNCNGSAYTGHYCETARCPGNCKTLSPSAGNCVSTNYPLNTIFKCECAPFAIGDNCEIDASACLNNLGQQCSGRGKCNPASGNHTTPYCICDEGFFGTLCQNFYCSIDQMIPGHGTCMNGISTGCYPPYSGPACAVDNCAIYGNGKVIGNPPSGCECNYPYTNQLNGETVASCWPQCPIANNTICGLSTTTAHTCVQFTDPMTATRIAICNCANGYIRNTTTGLCAAFCIHGIVPQGWTSTNLLPCICSANTGFDTNQGLNPRCDHPICGDLGIYNITAGKCDCIPPYNPFTKCITSLCTLNGASTAIVIPWLENGEGFRCSCPIPKKPMNELIPYDCNGHICTNNGIPNPNYNPTVISIARNACLCQGKYRTICNNTASVCNSYCQDSFCLNGGIPAPNDITKCQCMFPFFGDDCEKISCNTAQTLIADPIGNKCICKPGFTGVTCDQETCLNGGIFINNTCLCDLNTLFTGPRCSLITDEDIIIIPSPSMDASSSTGEDFEIVTEKIEPPSVIASLPVAIPMLTIGTIGVFGGIATAVYYIITNNIGVQVIGSIQEIAPLVGGHARRQRKK